MVQGMKIVSYIGNFKENPDWVRYLVIGIVVVEILLCIYAIINHSRGRKNRELIIVAIILGLCAIGLSYFVKEDTGRKMYASQIVRSADWEEFNSKYEVIGYNGDICYICEKEVEAVGREE